MVDKIRIGYFLEDRGHEIILKSLVARVAKEKGLNQGKWMDDVRAATGGKSIQAYKTFLRYLARLNNFAPFDILIIASDGNCEGYRKKKQQLLGFAEKIVEAMDIYAAAKNDSSFKHFIDDLKDAFTRKIAQDH